MTCKSLPLPIPPLPWKISVKDFEYYVSCNHHHVSSWRSWCQHVSSGGKVFDLQKSSNQSAPSSSSTTSSSTCSKKPTPSERRFLPASGPVGALIAEEKSMGPLMPSSSLPTSTRLGPEKQSQPINVGAAGGGKGGGSSSEGMGRRPIYPNFPFSPFTSPGTSPYAKRRQFKESQRVSVEKIGDSVQLNQYRLKQPIGHGAYGIVQLAYNEEDDKHYAMKILSKKKLYRKAGIIGREPPSRKSQKKAVENPLDRVYREVAVLKKLDHPNVVKLVEVLDDPSEDSLYLVFELLERGEVMSLEGHCGFSLEKPLPEEKVWRYFRDVVMGLEYLHYQKICHRDLKPPNLLLSDDDHIKIADFGVCNEFNGEDDAILGTLGTPAFIAPEALTGPPRESYSGKMADIWQLGVTLFALVFGRVPFYDTNPMKLYQKISEEKVAFPSEPEISPLLKNLLELMLRKDPKHRTTLPQIKNHPWVTKNGELPLMSEEENCTSYVEVTDEDIRNCVQPIPKLDTLILVKTMLKNHSFQHPFRRHCSSRNLLQINGRSHSAPSSYELFLERKMSLDSSILPKLAESRWEQPPSLSLGGSRPNPNVLNVKQGKSNSPPSKKT